MLYFYGKTNLLSPVEGPLTIIGNTKTRRAEVPTFLPFLCLVLHMKKKQKKLISSELKKISNVCYRVKLFQSRMPFVYK